MRRLTLLVLAAAAACGKSNAVATGDAPPGSDATMPTVDAGMPPLPTLGVQVDRAGRAGIVDTMIGEFGAGGAAKKDAYGQASDPTTWATATVATGVTVVDELRASLAALDSIDIGVMVNTKTLGCGNSLAYAPPAEVTSYDELAGLLADDQLYIDTSKASCTLYLAMELEYENGRMPVHTACGGRTPSYDAFDVHLSLVAEGVTGLDQLNNYVPRIHGSLTPHTVQSVFPFLSAPN